MQFFQKTNIDFVSKRQFFFFVSAIVIIGGIAATYFLGIDYGIDFIGGAQMQVKFEKDPGTEQIRTVVEEIGVTGSEIKSVGEPESNEYLIRIKQTSQDMDTFRAEMQSKLAEYKLDIQSENTIGPRIGKEIRTDAFIAVFLAIIAILLYIAFRFEFVFGLGAIVALAHDVVVTFTLLIIFHHLGVVDAEIDSNTLAGLLTVVGFSINDTVIIFDRIRENREKLKGISFIKLVNQSINETLSRTVNTVLTVILVLATMVLVGGQVLEGFAFTMLLGIITGTYSSIFIASSFVIWYNRKARNIDVEHSIDKKLSAKSAKA